MGDESFYHYFAIRNNINLALLFHSRNFKYITKRSNRRSAGTKYKSKKKIMISSLKYGIRIKFIIKKNHFLCSVFKGNAVARSYIESSCSSLC